jgi:hypothetical protein
MELTSEQYAKVMVALGWELGEDGDCWVTDDGSMWLRQDTLTALASAEGRIAMQEWLKAKGYDVVLCAKGDIVLEWVSDSGLHGHRFPTLPDAVLYALGQQAKGVG